MPRVAAEKAVFGLAGLTHCRRYTATNDDVSLPLRKRSSAGATTVAARSAFSAETGNLAFVTVALPAVRSACLRREREIVSSKFI